LLERSGYATKMLEFVSVEHTPKNNMLVGTRLAKPRDTSDVDREIDELKAFYGIEHHRLDELLKKTSAALG